MRALESFVSSSSKQLRGDREGGLFSGCPTAAGGAGCSCSSRGGGGQQRNRGAAAVVAPQHRDSHTMLEAATRLECEGTAGACAASPSLSRDSNPPDSSRQVWYSSCAFSFTDSASGCASCCREQGAGPAAAAVEREPEQPHWRLVHGSTDSALGRASGCREERQCQHYTSPQKPRCMACSHP